MSEVIWRSFFWAAGSSREIAPEQEQAAWPPKLPRMARERENGVHPRGLGRHVWQRTLPLFGPYRGQLLLAGACVAFTGAMVSVMPLFSRAVFDHLQDGRRDLPLPAGNGFPYIAAVMLVFLAAMAARMASWYVGQCHLLFIREQLLYTLRSRLFAHLQHLDQRFHARYSPGYLYDRTLGGATTAVGTFLTMFFNQLVTYLSVVVISLVICFRLHAGLTLWILGMSLAYVGISRYFGARIHAITKEVNLRLNQLAGRATDLLRGVKTIQAFAMEGRVAEAFNTELWPYHLRSLEQQKMTMRLGFATESLGYLVTAAVTVGSALLVLRGGAFSWGTMIAFIAYQGSLIGMFASISLVWGAYSGAVAGLEQIYEVLDERPGVAERPGAVLPPVQGGIRLEDVAFAYGDRPVLQGITLEVPPGQSVALVGPSGGGKTTLINLLLRFYDPDRGTVRLDGADIRALPLAPYRAAFGAVLQDPFLFNDSIVQNLLAAKPDATEAELQTALERAQAWEFVQALPAGWHTRVGDGGSGLSGGQRQRIALARCFLTDPRVMILDEATSALDNQSEWLVQQALQEIMQGRTVFLIAHRLSTVRHVDRILVLHDGRIVQDGAYPDLCAAPGLFRDLHQAALSSAEE
jgi:ABC-type multidrug transport system fused ATPase/permease subunit